MLESVIESDILINKLESISGKIILVIGDIILDIYIYTDVERISPEAPVPVASIDSIEYRLGGAGNVAQNIKALGGNPILIGTIGDDQEGKKLGDLLYLNQIENYVENGRYNKTITKSRIISRGQQLIRLDRDIANPQERSISSFNIDFGGIDGIIISDYNKGTISREVIEELNSIRHESAIPILVDAKPPKIYKYKWIATMITPNMMEAIQIIGYNSDICREIREWDEKQYTKLVRKLTEKFPCAILLKLGRRGGVLLTRDRDMTTDEWYHTTYFPAIKVETRDPTGSGDIVSAMMGLGITKANDHKNLSHFVKLAMIAAGLGVTKYGTAIVLREEIKAYLRDQNGENK